jgi:Raf kinase inhibitor-like YbhB/YbcL family protein
MRYTKSLAGIVAICAVVVSAALLGAQDKGGKKKGGIQLPPMINIKIADFPDGGRIPNKYTCAAGQGSPSPAMTWSGAPANTQSYVVIMHDPDPVLGGSATNDVLHWAIFDIPGDAKGLPEGVKNGDQPDGAKQINNIAGVAGYLGPCAPPGHGDHHYTFEVYALNAKLGLPNTTSRTDLMNAMNGKVIAKGVYIGIFGQK